MRKEHRYLAVVVNFPGPYVAVTELAIQTLDVGALYRHPLPAGPTIRSMRAGLYGPPNSKAIGARDFGAPPLPADFLKPLTDTELHATLAGESASRLGKAIRALPLPATSVSDRWLPSPKQAS